MSAAFCDIVVRLSSSPSQSVTRLSPSLFHLQADYNVIKRIDSGALRFLYKLRVLILNDNLIPVLPAHLFRFHPDLLLHIFYIIVCDY